MAHGLLMAPMGPPWVRSGDPWVTHGGYIGGPWGPWVSHGLIVVAHGSPIGRPRVAHGSPVVHIAESWATHASPMGLPYSADPWVAHGSPMGHGPPFGLEGLG